MDSEITARLSDGNDDSPTVDMIVRGYDYEIVVTLDIDQIASLVAELDLLAARIKSRRLHA